jgi:mannose-6-phosphate isomerase-like protein (cupin superfamily)
MSTWTQAEMDHRLIRYADLKGLRNAFIDARSPGSDRKENFTIIGPGVSENPAQVVHLPEPHGFNIGGARQPGGCLNSQHSHLTAEVMVVHSGKWRLLFGANKDEGILDIEPGDVCSIPTQMFRGFEKRDEGTGFLFFVLGGDDPGKVVWAPSVFKMAEDYGLKLLKGGKLIDTTLGEKVPHGAELELLPSAELLAKLKTPAMDKMKTCCASGKALQANPKSPLAGNGVEEAGVIVPVATDDGFQPGPIIGWWDHGFNVRRLTMQTGAIVPRHARAEQEVIFVQSGTLEVNWSDGRILMGAGDTLSVPVGLAHGFRNTASVPLIAFVVRGADSPGAPVFAAQQMAAE